ncbi:MAG: 4Fe-4S binding protein, partial [Syntrophobacteraceae bacterium]|nr:4Fe-4S binding protein [Syntrophobacteraceae bacterium]
ADPLIAEQSRWNDPRRIGEVIRVDLGKIDDVRVRTFAEIDLKISANLAMQEAERCFNCGLCNQCDNCRLFCPEVAVHREESSQGRHIDYDYCKGCGVCVVECPRHAMSLEPEQAS